MRLFGILSALALAGGGLASGQVINVDFDQSSTVSNYGGLAAAPDPEGLGAEWNQVTGSGNTTILAENLKNSAGDATTVGVSLEINGSFVQAGQQESGPGGIYGNLMSDYVYLGSPPDLEVVTKSGSIFGLAAGQLYDVYLYAQGDSFLDTTYSPGQNSLFTIGGVSKQTSWDGVMGGDGFLTEGIEYVRFRVAADAGGEIDFTWANVVSGVGGNVAVDLDGNNSRFAVINGLQIVAVPEPSSALLGGLAALTILCRRPRRPPL